MKIFAYLQISLFLFFIPLISFAQECIDTDGDGWGWDGSASCIPDGQENPSSSSSSSSSSSNSTSSAECVDTDGDGWGWDGQASCIVGGESSSSNSSSSNSNNNSVAVSGECVDLDGDGWGWDGSASCIIGNSSSSNNEPAEEPAEEVVSQPVSNNTSPGSCSRPPVGSVFSSRATPLLPTGNTFFPDAGQQCVTPSNQFNGPGLAWGDFKFINNAWNGQASTWNWSQCISVKNNQGNFYGSLEYDWGDEYALQPGLREWEVKTYPEIIYGVKEQGLDSGECEDTGLPASLTELPNITIDYAYSSTQTLSRVGTLGSVQTLGGDRNVAIESFLHSSCDIRRRGNSNIEFELMVWLNRGPERLPSGDPARGTYVDSYGEVYDVYTKPRSDPGYIAYVARNEPKRGTLNWNEFFQDARVNADAYGIKTIQDSWCLGNIIFGSEIWWGEGSIDFENFEITRHY